MYMKFESDVETEIIAEMLEENSNEDLLELIVQLDRKAADSQFTEEVILTLIKELKNEGYEKADWDNFFKQINKLK